MIWWPQIQYTDVESTDTPSSKIKDKQQYFVFVPPKFFHTISSNEKAQYTNVYSDVHQKEPQHDCCITIDEIQDAIVDLE